MKNNLFIPDKINVGFQKRNDTYTERLAYIIYFDIYDKLKQETSWNSWRDKGLANKILTNEPIDGFVLNKKAGGYASHYNMRQSYIRVYDPRGFEFEITVENLLFILENTNCIIGKGLEGKFVYSWATGKLVLLPCNSINYKELQGFNKALKNKKRYTANELVEGVTYLSSKNEHLVYIGKFYEYNGTQKEKKKYFFVQIAKDNKLSPVVMNAIGNKIIDIISIETTNFATLYEFLKSAKRYSIPYISLRDPKKDQYVAYILDDWKQAIFKHHNVLFFSNVKGKMKVCHISPARFFHFSHTFKHNETNSYSISCNGTQYNFSSLEKIFKKFSPHYLITFNAQNKKIEEFNYAKK